MGRLLNRSSPLEGFGAFALNEVTHTLVSPAAGAPDHHLMTTVRKITQS
jgi:hypothetical protein